MTEAHRPGSLPTSRTPLRPWHAASHTRSCSTSDTVAMGASKMAPATKAIRSYASSTGWSTS